VSIGFRDRPGGHTNPVAQRYPEGWSEIDGALERTFVLRDFREAIAFVNQVAELAEEANHHPDISVHGYRNVTLRYWTHTKGGITENDVTQAQRVNELAR
jgi:4a-hydroxytetrahydrobiopterin dehydratase